MDASFFLWQIWLVFHGWHLFFLGFSSSGINESKCGGKFRKFSGWNGYNLERSSFNNIISDWYGIKSVYRSLWIGLCCWRLRYCDKQFRRFQLYARADCQLFQYNIDFNISKYWRFGYEIRLDYQTVRTTWADRRDRQCRSYWIYWPRWNWSGTGIRLGERKWQIY